MNCLSLSTSEHNGLTFELLVDGTGMGELLNDGNEGIPYWLVENGLPTIPPYEALTNPGLRIVSVCGCGEYGCGHSYCCVEIQDESVVFSEFAGNVGSKGKTIQFIFPKSMYVEVCEQMTKAAGEFKAKGG